MKPPLPSEHGLTAKRASVMTSWWSRVAHLPSHEAAGAAGAAGAAAVLGEEEDPVNIQRRWKG